MKNKNKAKILATLMTLGIYASTLTIPAYANKTNEKGQSTSQEKTYTTKDYFFIRYNGFIFLTFRYMEKDGYNILYKYFDANTGRFIGQTITPYVTKKGALNVSSRIKEKINKTTEERDLKVGASNKRKADCYRLDLLDKKYYDGKYGLFYNLPESSVIPLNTICSSTTFKQQDFNYFTSNSSKLKEEIESKTNYTSRFVLREYIDFPMSVELMGFNDRTVGNWIEIEEFICTKKDGSNNIILGYRCSYFPSDNGYNYLYSLSDGDIIYIGEDSIYTNVEVQKYGSILTITELKEALEKKKQDELDRVTKKIKSENIRVFITSNWSRRGDVKIGKLDSYYFVVNNLTEISDNNSNVVYCNASDSHFYYKNRNGNAISVQRYLFDYKSPDDWVPVTVTLDEFLITQGYEDLIQADGYTKVDIIAIKNLIISEKHVLEKK